MYTGSAALSNIRKHMPLIIMFFPGFAIFLLFNYVPMYGILIAFKEYRILDGVWGSPWVGLDNFERLFIGDGFTNALRNTLVLASLKLLFVFPAPIVLALLLNEVRRRGFVRIIQTATYLPHFFSWVVLSGILFAVFGMKGAYNKLTEMFGIEPALLLLDPSKFYLMIVLTAIWQSIGWGSVIYFAALSSIDPTLYEAAIVDGASRWKRMIHVTLPGIVPTVIIMFLLDIGNFLEVGFDQIYNLMTTSTLDVADILDTYTLRRLLSMDFELGTAAGLFTNTVGLVLVVAANVIVQRIDPDQGLW